MSQIIFKMNQRFVCEHAEQLSIYCQQCSIAMCVQCMLSEGHNQHQIQAIPQACEEIKQDWVKLRDMYTELDSKCGNINRELSDSEQPQHVISKLVDREFDSLVNLVNEMRDDSKERIKNLECYQNYNPPNKDEIETILREINEQKQVCNKHCEAVEKFCREQKINDIMQYKETYLTLKTQIDKSKERTQNLNNTINNQKEPKIKVNAEFDKFKGILHEIVSFEPDLIHTEPQPRLHYFEDQNNILYIHNIRSQKTDRIPIQEQPNIKLPQDFTSIQARNKILITGGELKEQEGKWNYSDQTFEVDENTFQLIKRASMHNARCYHAMGYINKMSVNKTEDLVLVSGSKYPEASSKTCEFYDVWKNEWKKLPDMNHARHYHTVSVISDENENRTSWVYVIGGRSSDESPLDSIERLNFDEARASEENKGWEMVDLKNQDSAWSARDTCGSFPINQEEILIFGGDFGWLSDSFKFNVNTKQIEKLRDCSLKKPEEFYKGQCMKYSDDKIYAVGCLDKDVHVFSISANKWFMLEKAFIGWGQ